MTATVIHLAETTCWCGTPFALPTELLNAAQKAGHTIYCPHGHTVCWKDTEVDKLRRERDRLKQDHARLEQEKSEAWATANAQLERAEKLAATNKRLKKRASAGTCPCCSRTFQNMATHMKRQHPEFVSADGTNVVKLKAVGVD